jgi:epsilon-lactone hydrolase
MDIIEAMYRRWADGDSGSEDSWGDVTGEPRGVDYREVEAGGVPAMWIEPHGPALDGVIIAFHGGGFISGSLYTHRKLYGHLAKATGVRALLVHYRLAPEFPYPAQIEDALAAYRWTVAQGVTAALAGDSAGGGLCASAALRIRDAELPPPAALLLISPWVDMALAGSTYESNAATDVFFTRAMVGELVTAYLRNGESPKDPDVNVLHADLTGLPPMFIQAGGAEAILDESERLAERARAAGVEVRLDVFAGKLHTFQMAAGRTPEADDAIRRFAAWVRPKLGLPAREERAWPVGHGAARPSGHAR